MKKREEIPDEEVSERLRGCRSCPHKGKYMIHKDESLTMQPRVVTRVECGALNNQIVRPTKSTDYKGCHRLKHVENKHFHPQHLARKVHKIT